MFSDTPDLAVYEAFLADPALLESHLWYQCYRSMSDALKREIAQRLMTATTPARIAAMIGVDLKELVLKATAAIAEPASWKTQYKGVL